MKNTLNNKKNNVFMLFILFIGYTIVYTDKFIIGIVLVPAAKDLNLSTNKIGLILSAFFLGYSLMQIPAGFLNDKIGSKKVLALAQGLLGVFAICFGFGWSLVSLMIVRFCAGIGHAGYPASCSKTVATNFPVEKRTFIQSVLLASAGVAAVIAPLAGSPIIKTIGWKYTYIGLGVLATCVMISIIFFVSTPEIVKSSNLDKEEKVYILSVLKNPIVIILFLALLSINIVSYGLSSWIPSYLIRERGLDIVLAGKIAAVAQIGGAIASVCTGLFVGKYMQNKEKRVIVIATILAGASLYFLYNAKSLTISTSLLFIVNTCIMIAFVTMFTLPLKRIPQKIMGSSMGAINTGGTLGGFISPIIIGNLVTASNGTYGTTFMFLAITTIVSGALVLLLGNSKSDEAKRNMDAV